MRVMVFGSLPLSLVTFRRELLIAMAAQGHEVHACAPPADAEIVDQLRRMGVHFHAVRLSRAGINPLRDTATLIDLVRLLRSLRPHLLLGYTAKPVIYGSLAARYTGIPHIYSMIEGLGYAFSGTGFKRRLMAATLRALYRLALAGNQRVFFLNPDDLQTFAPILGGGDKGFMLGGIGVDLAHFAPQPLPREISFLMAGRLLWDKGIRHYVEAARLVHRRYPQIRFRLAGAMDENPSCVSTAELNQWIAAGDIDYLGQVADMRAALANASVFVLPSFREGVPVTVMEAMAAARPIITTDVPGCRETVVQGKNGFLVPVRDSAALAAAMGRFIEDAELVTRYGIESRRMAEARFDVHRVNLRLMTAMGLRSDAAASTLPHRPLSDAQNI